MNGIMAFIIKSLEQKSKSQRLMIEPDSNIFISLEVQNYFSFYYFEKKKEIKSLIPFIFQIIILMENKSRQMVTRIPIFETVKIGMNKLIDQATRPILKNVFNFSQNTFMFVLTQNYIVFNENQCSQITYYVPLTFDLKFQVIRGSWKNDETPGTPIGISFQKQKQHQKMEFYSNCPSIVNLWAKQLEGKINQRSFHKLFKAKKKIGKGAFASVYLAERLDDNKMVAVKAFSKEKQYSTDKGRQSLENQIKIMRILNHKNIIKLQGVFQTENSIYIILEYLQGQQLNQLLKDSKSFTQAEIKQTLRNILKGLSHLKKHNIIHRDLKPENIIFKNRNCTDLTICDFGLATYADEAKYLFVRCGTPGFVAPQIINIRDMNTKSQTISDVFSVGLIFHYLLFNRSIFPGKKYAQILAQNRACDFDFQSSQYLMIDQQALDLLKAMLQKSPQQRIDCDSALVHPYLNQNYMDIQRPMGIFNQIQNLKMKAEIKTPTTIRSGIKSYFPKLFGKQNISN